MTEPGGASGLLTAHGTLLCARADDAGVTHRPFSADDHPDQLALPEAAASLRASPAGTVLPIQPAGRRDRWLDGGAEAVATGRGTIGLRRQGRFLAAGPQGGGAGWIGQSLGAWEELVPLSPDERGSLRTLLASDWIARADGRLLRAEEGAMLPGFRLALGAVTVSIPASLPLVSRHWPFDVALVTDTFRVEELRLFRPLVFTVASGSPAVHHQMRVCLRSLHEFGGYEGNVHAVTDLRADQLLAAVRGLRPDRLTTADPDAHDFTGYVAAKYLIVEHAPAWEAQPILFVDPDIVFDRPVFPLLAAAAIADTLTAPSEFVGPLRHHEGVGATLLRDDGLEGRFARGFNAGTLGIPNLAAHAGTLRLVRQAIMGYGARHGRGTLRWVDQEMANYVGFRTGAVDTTALGRFVRYAGDGTLDGPPRGLVHFWGASRAHRHLTMERYVARLRADAAPGRHPV